MKLVALALMLVLVFGAVSVYMLHQRGFFTTETLELFLKPAPKVEEKPPEPIGLAASVMEERRRLEEEKLRMQTLAGRLEMQRRELEAERKQIEERLEQLRPETPEGRKAGEDLSSLVKMYESMPPEDAAPILENLSDEKVAQILLQMRKRQASQILAELGTDKAARISTLLLGQGAEPAK